MKIFSSFALAETTADRKKEADQLFEQGKQQYQTSQFQAALQSWQQALIIYREIKDRKSEGDALGNLGGAYSYLGQYDKAINYERQSLAIAREIKDRQGEGNALGNLGLTYTFLRYYTKAIDYNQQSLAIAREIKDRQGEGEALGNLGFAYLNRGYYDKAIDYYQQSLVIAREVKNRHEEGKALGGLGLSYLYKGDLRSSDSSDYEMSRLTSVAASFYLDLGQYRKAIEYEKQHLVIARELKDQADEWRALANLGFALYRQGNFTSAETSLLDSIKIAESLRSSLTDANKVSIFDTQTKAYITLQRVLIAQEKTQEALEIAERRRARAFVELLASRLSLSASAINPPNIQQIQQTAKKQNATIIEYSTVDNFLLYIWVIKPNGKITFRSVNLKSSNLTKLAENTRVATATNSGLPDDSALITNLVSDIRAAVGAAETNPSERCGQNQCLQQMYQVLIKPIADLLPANPDDKVIFIPHKSLFLIPFVALQDEQGKYLIEKHTILTAPSIQLLQLTHLQRQKIKQSPLSNITVVGNPIMPQYGLPGNRHQLPSLPGSEKEATNIAQILNTKPIIGAQATKAFVTQQMQQSNIIHLATHGLLNEVYKQGLPGAIALTPAGDDDGLLSSSEILDLKLKADLVVLSARNTGRGKLTGDGVIGLSRSLMSAGASSVVVSLWSVDDESTSFLMSEFYQRIQHNPDKAQGLRQAMLTTIKQYPEPKYWAAFTLMGEAL
ncbi:CHAT domain-containing protein [Microcoleus sp. MOSTC5]|uniref:CHAT domain-containing protein n=1 Tax=Microcoleus sp. MOSTC5 TaxID=3055378 RepID=UPI002FCF2B7E